MTDFEGTADEIGTDVVVVDQPPTTLFRTDDPVEVLERAGQVANALKSVIDKQGLITRIKGREHVRVEGWTTLGSMLGVVPVVVWTRRIEGGWEARVEARTMDGRTVGAAESMCTKAEGKPWNERPDYALRSMAQTRATSKALRGPLGFVVTLAGYEATPAEEMPLGAEDDRFTAPTAPQLKYLRSLITQHKPPVLTLRAMLDTVQAQDIEIVEGWTGQLTREQVSRLIELFKAGSLPDPEAVDVPVDDEPPALVGDSPDLPWVDGDQ